MTNLMTIYQDELTEQGLIDLQHKYPKTIVMDMSIEKNFKDARKIRTERNKLVEAINRRRIDVSTEIKSLGDSLIESVNGVYDHIVIAFEAEDKQRQEIKLKEEQEKQRLIDESREKINNMKSFVDQARRGNSSTVSSLIDAVTNIDCAVFHKDLIHEALEVKESVLNDMTVMLTGKLEYEESERIRKVQEAELKELREMKTANEAKEAEEYKKSHQESVETEEPSTPTYKPQHNNKDQVLTRSVVVSLRGTEKQAAEVALKIGDRLRDLDFVENIEITR